MSCRQRKHFIWRGSVSKPGETYTNSVQSYSKGIARWISVCACVNLSNMKEKISLYYKNNIDKLIHNHNFIKNNNYYEIFKNYILNT